MDNILMIAGLMAFNCVMGLVRFPGGLAKLVKTGGGWVFIYADLIALSMFMSVLIVGMSVGPTTWNKVKRRAMKAMCVGIVSFGIVVHQFVLTVLGENWRSFVDGSAIGFMVITCVSLFYVWYG